jgi:hypothetical protein
MQDGGSSERDDESIDEGPEQWTMRRRRKGESGHVREKKARETERGGREGQQVRRVTNKSDRGGERGEGKGGGGPGGGGVGRWLQTIRLDVPVGKV